MNDYDYTKSERQKRFREERKAKNLTLVREYVPARFAYALKALAAEMRNDPEKGEAYRKQFPEPKGDIDEHSNESATNS